jgi:hypothetical protein
VDEIGHKYSMSTIIIGKVFLTKKLLGVVAFCIAVLLYFGIFMSLNKNESFESKGSTHYYIIRPKITRIPGRRCAAIVRVHV